MIKQEPNHANSPRVARLAKKFRKKSYRDGYVASHTKLFIAQQMIALRGERSQAEFGKLLNKPQPVVSRLQNPHYGKYTLQTLIDVAAKLDVALIVRFVDHSTFLQLSNDFSDTAVRPATFSQSQVESRRMDFTLDMRRRSILPQYRQRQAVRHIPSPSNDLMIYSCRDIRRSQNDC